MVKGSKKQKAKQQSQTSSPKENKKQKPNQAKPQILTQVLCHQQQLEGTYTFKAGEGRSLIILCC